MLVYLLVGSLSLLNVYLIYRVTHLFALAEDWRKQSDSMEGEAEAWKHAAAQWERRYWELCDDEEPEPEAQRVR